MKVFSRSLIRPYLLSSRPELVLLTFSFITLLSVFAVAYYLDQFKEIGKQVFPSKVSQDFIVESLKVLGAAIFAGFVALLVTNVWQQKSIGFEMLKELNSPEFFVVRNMLSAQKKIAKKYNIDIDNIAHWFPNSRKEIESDIVYYTKERFTQAHALPSMIYFVVRLSNYARNGMLNIRVTKPLFNVFFVHYRILILEFAYVFEQYYETKYKYDPQSGLEVKAKMWNRRVEDLRFFFEIIGLERELPDNHIFQYFPTANKDYVPMGNTRYASECDLESFCNEGVTKEYFNKKGLQKKKRRFFFF